MAKAVAWSVTDTDARKRGEQIGLDTLVVHAVNQKQSQNKGACLCCDERRQHGTGAKRNVVCHKGHINRKHKGEYP